MTKLAKFKDLLANYPNYDLATVKTLVGGRVDANYITNACAIRVSRALSYSGTKIPFIEDINKIQQTLKGADGLWYIYRVKALDIFMAKTFGAASVLIKSAATVGVKTDKLLGKSGIIGMDISWADATGHFTLWNGKDVVDGHSEYFQKASAVRLWANT